MARTKTITINKIITKKPLTNARARKKNIFLAVESHSHHTSNDDITNNNSIGTSLIPPDNTAEHAQNLNNIVDAPVVTAKRATTPPYLIMAPEAPYIAIVIPPPPRNVSLQDHSILELDAYALTLQLFYDYQFSLMIYYDFNEREKRMEELQQVEKLILQVTTISLQKTEQKSDEQQKQTELEIAQMIPENLPHHDEAWVNNILDGVINSYEALVNQKLAENQHLQATTLRQIVKT